jgi:integrase
MTPRLASTNRGSRCSPHCFRGHMRIPRPKVGTPLLFPLTDQIASALLDDLRHNRLHSIHRRLFLRVREPQGPIASTAICDAFDAWMARAGIRLPHLGGTHCLRHALAMHLLREETPIKTIGDLLGHRSVEYRHLSAPRCRRPTRRCLAVAKCGRAGGATMTAPVAFASVLGPIISRYLDLKRALGRRAHSLQ